MSEEKKLIKHLLDNYEAVGNGGRPVLNITSVMSVEFGLGLIQMDLDERYKVLKMSMWSRYVSTSVFLKNFQFFTQALFRPRLGCAMGSHLFRPSLMPLHSITGDLKPQLLSRPPTDLSSTVCYMPKDVCFYKGHFQQDLS